MPSARTGKPLSTQTPQDLASLAKDLSGNAQAGIDAVGNSTQVSLSYKVYGLESWQ